MLEFLTELVKSKMASSSLIYEVMHGYVNHALSGLVNRREDNGEGKISEEYETDLLIVGGARRCDTATTSAA